MPAKALPAQAASHGQEVLAKQTFRETKPIHFDWIGLSFATLEPRDLLQFAQYNSIPF